MAGRTASKVVAWVVPQLMDAIDNPSTDIDRTMNRIITGVLHHPAQRDQGEDGARDGRALMFKSVQEWWSGVDQDEYRRKLSRTGVERGDNHKEGVQDTGHGHGCAGKLGMHKQFGGGNSGPQTMEDKIATEAAGAIVGGLTSGFSNLLSESTGGKVNFPTSSNPTQGGGLMGAASSLLSGAFSAGETDTYESRPQRQSDGGVKQTIEQYGRSQDGRRFEQAELTDTRYADGRETQEFQRFEQRSDGRGREEGYGYEERQERRSGSGGFQKTEERSWEGRDNFQQHEQREPGRHHGGGDHHQQRRDEQEGGYGGGYGGGGFGGGRREEERRDEGFGGGFGGGGGRREEESSWGGGRQEERREQGGGFGGFGGGGGRRHEEERRDEGGFSGGFGQGGRRHEEPERQEYGGGGGGGWGGGQRRGNNEDEDEERREGGGGGWGEQRRRSRSRSRSRDRNEGGGGGGWFS